MHLKHIILAAGLSVAMAGAASAVTLTVTEGTGNNRDRVLGSVDLEDAPSGSPGIDLDALNGGAFGADDSVQIHGRIVGATDQFTYTFESMSAFNLAFDFDGYEVDADNNGVADFTVNAGYSGLINQNLVDNVSDVTAPAGGKGVTITLVDSMNNIVGSVDYTTNVTSLTTSDASIFANVAAGSYTLIVDGSIGPDTNVPALYDLELAAIPLPAPALLLLAGLGGLAATRRRKKA